MLLAAVTVALACFRDNVGQVFKEIKGLCIFRIIVELAIIMGKQLGQNLKHLIL